MPWYDFQCEDCEHVFEEQLSVDDNRDDLECPQCGGKKIIRVFLNISTCTNKSDDSCSSDWQGG